MPQPLTARLVLTHLQPVPAAFMMTRMPTAPLRPARLRPGVWPMCRTFNQWLTYGQAAALIAIAVAAIGGIGQAGWEMIAARSISLGDLLMLFLYVEILSMVKGAALGTREIPIHTPIALAIVAVARYIVVDVEHISPNYMLFTSSSILVLVLALWLVRKAPNNDNP